mgnify:CR=1 FL=1
MKAYQPQCEVLSNGTRLVYLKVPSQVAHLGFFFAAGSRHESERQIGLAHFLEHCLFKGTQKRKALHILSRIDAVGGGLQRAAKPMGTAGEVAGLASLGTALHAPLSIAGAVGGKLLGTAAHADDDDNAMAMIAAAEGNSARNP